MSNNRFARNRQRHLIQLAVAIIAFLAVDVMLPSTLKARPSDFFASVAMALAIGICIGQINLISIWAALAPGRILVRLPWSLLLTVILWAAVCLGLRWVTAHTDGYYEAGLMIGGAQLAAQVPLWIGALNWKWRLSTRTQRRLGVDRSDTQFNIQHMMLGTLILAVTLAVLRMTLPGEPDWSLVGFDARMIVILIAASCTNLLIVVPCVWLAFVPRARLRGTLRAWAVLVILVSFVEDTVVIALLGKGTSTSFAMILLVTLLINFAQCGVVVFVLLKLRSLGFRLVQLGMRK